MHHYNFCSSSSPKIEALGEAGDSGDKGNDKGSLGMEPDQS